MYTATSFKPRRCILQKLGTTPYEAAWEIQRSLVKQRLDDPSL